MLATKTIIVDASMPVGVLNGFNAAGDLVVSIRYMPYVERLIGTEADESGVVSWRTSREDARRIAAIAAWNSCIGHPVAGRA